MYQKQFTVQAINAFNDNYIWAITPISSNRLTLVDPGDANVCIDFIEKNNLQLETLLITHHHHDHIGGIETLYHYAKKHGSQLKVYGPSLEDIPFCQHKVQQGDSIFLNDISEPFTLLDIPGHTNGHVAYYQEKHLFCGDTLFSAGCGRIFDGSASQLFHSLTLLANLPEDTLVYCAHEYTLANIDFALMIEPNNLALQRYQQEAIILRKKNLATIPSSIKQEKAINPFLRCRENAVKDSAEKHFNQKLHNQEAVFTALRKWKDSF